MINVMNLHEFSSSFREKYCSLIAYLLLKPKPHIHHSCLINHMCLDETTRIRWDKSLQKALMNSVLLCGEHARWICNWNEAFFKHHVTPPPIYPSMDWSLYSLRPSFESNRCGMNLNDTWSSHRRFFKKVFLVAAFSFLLTHFYNTDCYWVYSLLRLLWVKPYKNLCIDERISKHQLIIVSTVWQILCRILTGCHWKHGQRRRMSTLTSHWAGTHTHIHTHTFGIQ